MLRSTRLRVFLFLNMLSLADFAPTDSTAWLSMCNRKIKSGTDNAYAVFHCNVPQGGNMLFSDIRNWASIHSKGIFGVSIICEIGGRVSLPWPFKANNLVSLEVRGCALDDFLSEMTYSNITQISDHLRILIISDVSIHLGVRDLHDTVQNIDNITRDADCGQLTLHRMVFRNIHFNRKTTESDLDIDFHGHNSTDESDFVAADSLVHHCSYNDLTSLDESGSRSMGKYHLRLLTENSMFPRLEEYILRNNNFSHVPHKLQTWIHNFPNLRVLDLSENELVAFEFDLVAVTQGSFNTKYRLIDLRKNKIGSVSIEGAMHLQRIGDIIVDLRENPLYCNCRLADFRRYLQEMYEKYQDEHTRQLLSDIKCSLPFNLHNSSVLDSSLDHFFNC
ncbi:hypothetical protein CHS0354_018125 [Potamilus streckersoni]|uniref:Uncharacterized protein n=1 Tax=Potamilus streckersoni TaxID=2493646 RepID=A0AAE0STA3_9BIVA|nr:hypothetical protein CHS0354_018125 [Potamilus streckersoni]